MQLSAPAVRQTAAMDQLAECIIHTRDSMASHRLKLNEEKTQVIWLGTRQQLAKVTATTLMLQNAAIQCSSSVKNLGFILDSQLTMADHVLSLSKSCFFQLRQLQAVRKSLPADARQTLVQSFIHNRLDYCNSVLVGITGHQMKRLQSIQNAAARLIVGASKYDAITPTLRDLHWLPMRQRIDLAFKRQHGMAPPYLTAMFVPTVSQQQRQRLRSSSTSTLLLPRTQTRYGDRNFAVAGPAAWNCLSAELRRPDLSMAMFRRLLKNSLFTACVVRTLTISALGAMR